MPCIQKRLPSRQSTAATDNAQIIIHKEIFVAMLKIFYNADSSLKKSAGTMDYDGIENRLDHEKIETLLDPET